MLTKIKLNLEDLQLVSAEHESALAKMQEAAQKEQKREAWLKKRQYKFSSSNCHRLMTYEDKIDTFPKGAMTYVEEVVIEILTAGKGKKNFTNDSMDRGTDEEKFAVLKFEEKTRLKLYATNEDQEFIQLSSYFGGTPDGLFDGVVYNPILEKLIEDGLVEIKCPDSKTHLFYLRNLKNADDLKKHCTNYYWQIQGNLLASGRKTAYFISYDDRFENEEHQWLCVEIPRNEDDITKLKKRLQMAEKHKQELLKF